MDLNRYIIVCPGGVVDSNIAGRNIADALTDAGAIKMKANSSYSLCVPQTCKEVHNYDEVIVI